MDLDALTPREKDVLLTHFFHYLPQTAHAEAGENNRDTIAREYPGIYNRLCGREIVETTFPHERAERDGELDGLRRRVADLEEGVTG